ncbi:MAG TPA: hypothetical protein VF652_08500 [Allosphingosinicella sp.]|jgi:hypothetical protein
MATTPSNPISTAAVNWLDSNGQVHLRIYSSDGYTVTERCWDEGGWTSGSFKASGEAVSATSWQGGGGLSIRVYCTFEDQTTEWCWDQGGGGWYQGGYTTS